MSVISVSEARRTLPAQIDLVEAGERVEITRHGKVVAVLVSPSAVASPRTAEYYKKRPCAAKVENAARIFAGYLMRKGEK